MKRFLDFIKSNSKHSENINPHSMVHGSHTQIKNINPYSMVHGSHAHVQEIREGIASGLITRLISKIPRLTNNSNEYWIAKNDNSNIGKDLPSTHQKLTTQTGDILNHPNFKELKMYINNSKFLNDGLRDYGVQRIQPPERIDGINVNGLDNIVNSNKTQQKMTVYHGAGFNPLELAQRHPNLEFSNPGYTSTSIDKKIAAYNFAHPFVDDNINAHRHVISVNVPKGHPGVYIGADSKNKSEREFLLPRNTTFRLRSSTPRTYTNQDKTFNIHVWDTDIVPEEKE